MQHINCKKHVNYDIYAKQHILNNKIFNIMLIVSACSLNSSP